jgi:hypothetical protein
VILPETDSIREKTESLANAKPGGPGIWRERDDRKILSEQLSPASAQAQ